MKSYEQKLILFGLYTLVVSAILGIVAVLLTGTLPGPEQTSAWAEVVTSNAYRTSNYLLIYAFLIPIPGFWAIHRLFAADKTPYLLSFWGMILSILGSALPMTAIGVSAFSYPAIGRMYLSQGMDLVTLTQDIFTANVMVFLLFSGFYYLTGIVLFGIVLWRNRAPLLKIASVALILHGILIILPEQIMINLLSWVFLLVSSVLLIIFAHPALKNQRSKPDKPDTTEH